MRPQITVEIVIEAPLNKVWEYWTKPEHIIKWNFASADWCCPKATNDLKVGGKFNYRMEACDGSEGFDFEGMYTEIQENKFIEYILGDERKVKIEFIDQNGTIKVVETFDAENTNSLELQRTGWQSILDNFKKHVTGNAFQ